MRWLLGALITALIVFSGTVAAVSDDLATPHIDQRTQQWMRQQVRAAEMRRQPIQRQPAQRETAHPVPVRKYETDYEALERIFGADNTRIAFMRFRGHTAEMIDWLNAQRNFERRVGMQHRDLE